MEKEKNETKIAVQVPEKLWEEISRMREEQFPETTEEEFCWLAVRMALDKRKAAKVNDEK